MAEGQRAQPVAAQPVALVTGAAAGIGWAVTQGLLAEGFTVLGLDRASLPHPQERLVPVAVDLLDGAAVAEVAAALARDWPVSHIVHNAGLVWPALVEAAQPAQVAGLAQLHLTSPLILTQALLPGMRARRFGRIVFVSSRAAMGVATRSAYAATKAGVHGLARTWALELGPDGITVNVVAPGPVQTDNFWGIIDRGSPQEAALAANLPVRRLGQPADVARAVRFFLDDGAGFVTGQVLFVCGGASLGGLSL